MRRFVLLLACAAACGLLSASAQAAVKTTRGPCGTGPLSPTCYFWTGKVVFIGDGDTISVVLDGDKSKTHQHVRFAGINATEEYVHTDSVDDRVGECHANDATDELVKLVKASRYRVRLAAQNPNAMSGGNRIRRAVFVLIRGKWRDVGRELMKRGDALFLNGDEHAWNYSYSVLAQRAAAQKVGIWNPNACAPGPPANVKLWVNSDADGADASNPNGEWIRIKNMDPVNPLPLGGWWVRDSGLRRYVFPLGEEVPPNQTVTVFIGRGTNTPPSTFFWGLRSPIFENAGGRSAGTGDGAYLFDPDGDIRAYMQYPCRWHCGDPLKGKVSIDATYKPRNEYVTITNTSNDAVDLEGYRLFTPGHTYAFTPPSTIPPGASMQVFTQGSPSEDSPLVKHWGIGFPVLDNNSDRVLLGTFDYVTVACQAWGTASCTQSP